MATTMKLIAKQTLSSTVTQVTFDNIPQTYTDLLILLSLRGNSVDRRCNMRFNNVSTGTYSNRLLTANGSTPSSTASSSVTVIEVGLINGTTTANTFSNTEIYIPNYAGSTNKSVSITSVSENNGTTAFIDVAAGLWSSTSAISRVDFYPSSDSMVSGSSFYLYGITKA